jgi:hypothetical protein
MADTVIELEGAAQIFDRTRNVMESAKACSAPGGGVRNGCGHPVLQRSLPKQPGEAKPPLRCNAK